MPEGIQKEKIDQTILTVREVAEYLRMSETKIYRLVKERCLPAVRIGKSWRFRKDLLDIWLSQRMDIEGVPGMAVKNTSSDSSPRD